MMPSLVKAPQMNTACWSRKVLFFHPALVVSICLALRATAVLLQVPSHMDSAWGTICPLLCLNGPKRHHNLFNRLPSCYRAVWIKKCWQDHWWNQLFMKGVALFQKTCWMFCLQWPQNRQWLLFTGQRGGEYKRDNLRLVVLLSPCYFQ